MTLGNHDGKDRWNLGGPRKVALVLRGAPGLEQQPSKFILLRLDRLQFVYIA
jgi:hypothetical protein